MIDVTTKAIEAIKRIRDQEPGHSNAMLRVRVVPGGCSGMSYKLDFDSQPAATGDKVFEKEDLRIVVDAKSYLFIAGMVIDFKDGLNGSGFVFKNPNAKETCGCGESFSS